MDRREAVKIMAFGALGALMGLPKDCAPMEVDIVNSEGGGIITGCMPPKSPEQTMEGIIQYFRDMRAMGYDFVTPCDDPVRLRVGWLFCKDVKFRNGTFDSDHPMFNPQIDIAAFKGFESDSEMGQLVAQSLETAEGKIALVEALKHVAGWPA